MKVAFWAHRDRGPTSVSSTLTSSSQLAQIFGEGEQRHRLRQGGHRVAGVDRARHHAIDRQTDRGSWKVGRRWRAAPARCSRRRALSPPRRARAPAARAVSISVGAGTLPPESLRTSSRARLACAPAAWPPPAPRWPAVPAPHASGRSGRAVWRCRADQHLALLHRVVHVHQHARHRARELAVDVDRARRLQRAKVGADGNVERGMHRLGDVARRRGGAGRSATTRRRARARSRGHAAPHRAALPPRAGGGFVEQRGNLRRCRPLALVFMRSRSLKRAAASSRRPGSEECTWSLATSALPTLPRCPARRAGALRGQHGLKSTSPLALNAGAPAAALSAVVAAAAQARQALAGRPAGATSASSTSLSAVSTLARWPARARRVRPAGHRSERAARRRRRAAATRRRAARLNRSAAARQAGRA